MIQFKNLFAYFVAILVSFSFMACEDEGVEPTPELQTIAEIAAGDDQFSTLVGALERVGLVSVLDGTDSYTVFAPTNTAFESLGVDLNTLSDEALTEILLYHVLGAPVPSKDLMEGQTYVTTATATGPGDSQLSLLIEKDMNGGVELNGAVKVTSADIEASNGVIHVIDGVLLPLDIVGHAIANDNFTSLVGALQAAEGDLVSTLSTEGPWTVFAPLNSAFDEISDVVAGLDAGQLASVLTYHVVALGNISQADLSEGMVETVQGESFSVSIDGDGVTLTDANGNTVQVILTDVQTTNGIIHVIDGVLIPAEL